MWGFVLTTDPYGINDTKNKNERRNSYSLRKKNREGFHYFSDDAIIKNAPHRHRIQAETMAASLGWHRYGDAGIAVRRRNINALFIY